MTKDGYLHIKPTLTADEFGEAFLYNGTLNLNKNEHQCNIGRNGNQDCEMLAIFFTINYSRICSNIETIFL